MAFEVTYTVDEEMQMRSARQLLRLAIGSRFTTIIVVALLAALLTLVLRRTFVSGFLMGALLVLAIIAAGMRAQVARMYERMARGYLDLDDDHAVTVIMDDEAFEMRHSSFHRRVAWNKVDRVADTEDFTIIYHGIILLATLPKAHLGPEGLDIIRRHTPGAKQG